MFETWSDAAVRKDTRFDVSSVDMLKAAIFNASVATIDPAALGKHFQ
jgi:hypothetical protein